MFPLLTGRAVPTCPPGEVVRGSGKPRPVPEVEGKLRGYLVAVLEHHFAIWAEDWQIAHSGERRSGKVAAEELGVDDTPFCTGLHLREPGRCFS